MKSGSKQKIIEVFELFQKQFDAIHETQAEIVCEVTVTREIIHEIKNKMVPIASAADAWTRESEADAREITKLLRMLDILAPKVDAVLNRITEWERRLARVEGVGTYGDRKG